jgi:A nuclease family of the HNH/ENDO VII superfamily with conserved AHH
VTGVRTLSFAADDFAPLYIEGAAGDEQYVSRGESKAATWRVPDARWERDTGRPIPDFEMLTDLPVVTTEAYEALQPVLDGRGEVLPLDVTDGPDAVAFNVTRVIDALDEERSEIKRFSSGRVMRVARPVFIPDRVKDETVFRVTTYPRTVYVTDRFLEAAEAIGLEGMRLSEDWLAEPSEPAPAEGERVYTQLVPDDGPPDELVAHHIIPPLDVPSDSLQRAQAHAQALGIDPDEAANGVALPRARHQGAYTDSYFDALWERFRDADDRDTGVAVLERIGAELAEGRFP